MSTDRVITDLTPLAILSIHPLSNRRGTIYLEQMSHDLQTAVSCGHMQCRPLCSQAHTHTHTHTHTATYALDQVWVFELSQFCFLLHIPRLSLALASTPALSAHWVMSSCEMTGGLPLLLWCAERCSIVSLSTPAQCNTIVLEPSVTPPYICIHIVSTPVMFQDYCTQCM